MDDRARPGDPEPRLLDLMSLEEIDRDLYRAGTVFPDPFALFGGQVAAQALIAAGRTVDPDRPPNSLHGYFLRRGDARRPVIFHVERDRDGRSYSGRRVIAVQGGEVLLNMSVSFHVVEKGQDAQVDTVPAGAPPDDLPAMPVVRLFDVEGRLPTQPRDDLEWPTRMWLRASVGLPDDPLLHAAVLTYISDLSSGLGWLNSPEGVSSTSLDHAVWFHRPARADRWLLMDLVPHSVSGGRGWYTGSLFDEHGTLVASLAQEALFRPPRNRAQAAKVAKVAGAAEAGAETDDPWRRSRR